MRQRVRTRRTREVVEAEPEHDGAADPAGGAHPPGDAVDERDESASSSAADLGARPSARCEPIERRRRRGCTGRGSRLCASAWRWRPDAAAEHRHERRLVEPGDLADRGDAAARSFPAVTAPTPQSRSTGSGCRNASSPSGGTTSRPSGLATPLATLARNFVRAIADGDRQTDPLAHVAPQPRRDLDGRARDPLHPANVEERLVDREPLDERRRVVEDPEQRLARLGVGRHARRDDDRLRAEPPRLPPAHRRPDAVRLGLVARREHDAAADDHRPAAQAAVVALLDRREERVGVGVEDRRLAHTNICSHRRPPVAATVDLLW